MISVLVVNLNNLEFTKNCINDLLGQDTKSYITLIDQNSSEEGTVEYLDFISSTTDISVIKKGENFPLNHLWNWFTKISETPYVCLLNNDVRLSPNFLSSAIGVFEKEPGVGFVNHATNNNEYSEWSEVLQYVIIDSPYRQGWDLFFRKDNFHKIPENLIFYFGDDYIFSKLYSSGYKGAYVLNSPMIHLLSSTTPEKGRVDSGFSDRKNFEDLNLEYQHLSFNENICRWYPEFYQISKK